MRLASIESGKLDREIEIIQNTASGSDGGGFPNENWTTYAKVWAAVRYLRASQRLLGGQETSERTLIVKTRYMPDVHERMRIIFEGRTYRIAGFAPDFRNDFIEFTCEWVENNNVA